MRSLALVARDVARRFGVDLVRYPTHDTQFRVAKLLDRLGVDCVLDVGANAGQYATELRDLGYTGRIRSFEPLKDAYAELARVATGDAGWSHENIAVGAENTTTTINVAKNSYSSSLRDMLPLHDQAAPSARVVGSQEVVVERLDTRFDEHIGGARRVFLKVDTQGFEDQVLAGCGDRLDDVCGLQLEMSLQPLYAGQKLFADIFETVTGRGFTIVDVAPEFADPTTAAMLQANGVFVRDAVLQT